MFHRRDAMIRLGQLGLGSLSLPNLLRAEQTRSQAPLLHSPSAKSCILIYLWGGPPQQDMWDMKPLAAEGIRSQFQPIQTVVPGIDVCEHMPLFARHTDKTTIIRSLTHDSNNHEPSVYRTLTGRINNTLVVPRNQRNRNDFPTTDRIVRLIVQAARLNDTSPAHAAIQMSSNFRCFAEHTHEIGKQRSQHCAIPRCNTQFPSEAR